MEQFEALWLFQAEDMKADAIASAIKRSPTRQKLEKTRDLILERQKQYKQIESDTAAMVDRKDIITQALDHSQAQLTQLRERFEKDPPQTAENVRSMMAEVGKCRETIRQYELEINRIVKESAANDKLQRSVRLEAANAKKQFDELKAVEEYNTIKRRISPPVARLTHGQCSGCNTSLPSAILSKIKGGALVECETCGRMIIQ